MDDLIFVPMRLKNIFLFLFSIYGFTVFLLFMFLLLPFIFIASFFGKEKGGNLIYSICTFWADAACFLWGIHHHNIYSLTDTADHPVVFVFNHISYIDIPILLKAFRKHHIRVLGKSGMSKIPVFGFIYRNAAVMVDRSSAEARAASVKKLISFLQHNISVVIAPEGTFNLSHKPLKEFYDGAFRIAIETQTPVQPVIFPDTFDRLSPHNIFSLNPGRSRAVFLTEIPVSGLTMNDIAALKMQTYHMMESALAAHKASWIK